ncbi:amidohydrolase family protein, partial [Eubacterium sp.]|uniref:amidohydrolase family protein n=1 Tax=Eubacterium sp. TaxID=142586 RepID=UPI003EFC39E2
EEGKPFGIDGFDGIKICAGRLKTQDLTKHYKVFEEADKHGKFISIDLADGDLQTGSLKEMIQQYPNLRIAIGHFGMVTRKGWTEQIKLAQNKNVMIESGGITWLFNSEWYPYSSAVKAIKEAVDICGIDKLMWGSDYPRTMVEITYKMSFDFILKSKELTQAEKKKFLFDNAKTFYGFADLTECERIKNML